MLRVLLIRPLVDALPLAKILQSKRIDSLLYPLFEPHFFSLPLLKTPQALIITSKNALRAIETKEELKKIPLYGVGDQTATLAQRLGFSNVLSASGRTQELIDLVLRHTHPKKGILCHLSGEVMKGNIVKELRAKGFEAERHIVYRIQEAKNFSETLLFDLQNKKISHVMFFSPHTTTIFVNLINKNAFERIVSRMTAVCLSHEVAEKARSLGWQKIWISPQPAAQNMMGYFDEEKHQTK